MDPRRFRLAFPLAVLGAGLLILFAVRHRAEDDGNPIPPHRGLSPEPALVPADLSITRTRPAAVPVAMPAPLDEPRQRPASVIGQLQKNEQASLQAALHEARHAISPADPSLARKTEDKGVTHFASNPGQDIRFGFLENGGVRLLSGQPGKTWQGTLRLKAPGTAATSSPWKTRGTRAERETQGLTEWYINRTDGMEHGFTLAGRPTADRTDEPALVRLTLDGLLCEVDPARAGDLVFTDPVTRRPVLGYRNLQVWDADGRQLPADMRPTGDGLLIAINDTAANYPLTIDPLIVSLEQELRTLASLPQQRFGLGCAIDGDTLAVGGVAGPVCVFTRTGSTWSLSQKINPPSGKFDFGGVIAISGNSMAIYAQSTASGFFSANICHYEKTGGVWNPTTTTTTFTSGEIIDGSSLYEDPLNISLALEGDILAIGSGSRRKVEIYKKVSSAWVLDVTIDQASNPLAFGYAIDISGSVVAVGAPEYNASLPGKVYLYRKSGSLWMDLSVLTAAFTGENFGSAVALSGNHLVVGARFRDVSTLATRVGCIHPYEWNGTNWVSGSPVFDPTPVVNGQFGASLALDGSNLLVGSLHDDAQVPGAGSVSHFTFTGGLWTFRQAFTPPSVVNGDLYSHSLALSGNLLAVGAPETGYPHADRAGTLFPYSLSAGGWTAEPNLKGEIQSHSAANDNTGLSVDIDGDSAIVGALNDDSSSGVNCGSAYFFRRNGNTWNYEAKIASTTGILNGRFGVAVAISGNSAVIGADYDRHPGDTVSKGSITICSRASGTWTFQKLFVASSDNAQFGRSVAISGNEIIVGGPGYSNSSGYIVTFRYDGTDLTGNGVTLPPFPQNGAQFGFSVAIEGNRLIVGEPRADITYFIVGTLVDCGYAHVFSRPNPTATWSLVTSFSNSTENLQLGFSVAVDGDTAVIGGGGAYGWTGSPPESPARIGNAYTATYSAGAWGSLVPLSSTGLTSGAYFGNSVAIDGDLIAVGAFANETATGKVRIFRRNGASWTFLTDISAPGLESDNAFGVSTALSGDSLVVGAYGADTLGGTDTGTAYVFRVTDLPPVLSISHSGTNVVLTWAASPGWTLHRSATLLSGSWLPVTVAIDGTHTHPILPTEPRMFFRLQKP